MLETTTPQRRIILLIKAQKFAHQAGYYLQGGRWHAVKEHKPAPKGVPMASHPEVAHGEHVKPFVLPMDQIEQLKLPDANTNAGTFNKQLITLLGYAAKGDATAILGMGIGSNTYGAKLAKVANYLLQGMGVAEHVVAHGQKAGEHAAVQAAPAEPVGEVDGPMKGMTLGAKLESYAPEKLHEIANGGTSYLDKVKEHAAATLKQKHPDWKKQPHPDDDLLPESSKPQPEPVTAPAGLVAPEFVEGKKTKGVKAYYDKQAAAIIAAPDLASLQAIKKPELGSWQGKTPNSKKLLALFDQAEASFSGAQAPAPVAAPEPTPAAPEPVAAAPAPIQEMQAAAEATATEYKLDQIPWDAQLLPDTNSNAGTHNKKVAAIKAAAYAGDLGALEAMKFGTNTYNKKAALLAQTAIAAIKESAQPLKTQPEADAELAQMVSATQAAVAAPEKPAFNSEHWSGVADKIEAMMQAGDAAGIEHQVKLTNNFKHENGQAINAYAKAALAQVQAGAPPDAKSQLMQTLSEAGSATSASAAYWQFVQGGGSQADGLQALHDVGFHATAQKIADLVDTPAIAAINAAKEKGDDDPYQVHEAASSWHLANPTKGAELSQALVDAGHSGIAADLDLPVPDEDDGPQDGDTKPGANGGMLVFKDGRWHKSVAADESGEVPPVLVPVDDEPPAKPAPTHGAIKPKEAISLGVGLKTSKGNKEKLKAMAVAGDAAGLQNFLDTQAKGLPASKMYAEKLLAAMAQSTAAPGAPKPKPAPKAAAPSGPALESIDKWQQTGPQGGSNPGGRFKDAEGVEWYCKFPANEDIAKSEVLAAKLYGAAGVAGQDAKLITKGGKTGIASRWVTVKKATSPQELAATQGAQSGFAVDAWLANWDVVGLGYDNLQVGADGKAMRVDAGGSLEYRAQGSKKPFGPKVDEIDTMRNASNNAQSASIFGKMTTADLTASAAKVANISDAQIRAIVEEFGPGDKDARKAMADTLIARKQDLIARFPKAGKTPKKRLDPTKLPVQAGQLPKVHDFQNWSGAGSGLSSKPHINAANQAVEQAALDTALAGNLPALKEFKYTGIDKETGNSSATSVPIAQHPSKHVVQYHADLVQALDEIANPPAPLKIFRETDVGTLAALDAAFPPKPFGTTVGSVSSSEKMGFWVALGAIAPGSVKKLTPKKVREYSSHDIASAKAKYKDAKPLAKHFIKSVQSSGSYNDLFRDGKTVDGSGNKLTDVAQAALEHATTMPEGTSVYRWQTMSDQMLKHIMSAPDGTVFQATGPMCTSYSPTATAGFGKHRVVIRYAEGAKAVESFGSGGFAGEKEVTTLPNNRYVILSKKMVPDAEHHNPKGERAEIEILMLPPDLGLPNLKG